MTISQPSHPLAKFLIYIPIVRKNDFTALQLLPYYMDSVVIFMDNISLINMHMVSSYRLGDLILLSLTSDEQQNLITEHPNTVGSKFIDLVSCSDDKIELVKNIVLEYTRKIIHLLPEDIENSTLVHLRLGDVVAGNEWHEKLKRPLEVHQLVKLVNTDKTYVIGKCFYAKESSTNYDECGKLSDIYLRTVLNQLNATHFDSGNADIDLCCAVKCKRFIQGRGYFSQLIVEIREKMDKENIKITT